MAERTDDDLETLMRAGLQVRADRTDVSVLLAERARAASGRRRSGRLAVIGTALAAAAAVVVVAMIVRPVHPHGHGPSVSDQTVTDPPSVPMRTEYWRGVQVQVPATWGWGSEPYALEAQPVLCGSEPDHAYVGRPILLSDACDGSEGLIDRTPTVSYVWFDAPIAAGIQDLGDGWTRVTTEVAGVTVSVATQDAALRQRILDSVRQQSLCPASYDVEPDPDSTATTEGTAGLEPHRLVVCAYRLQPDRGFGLAYAEDLDADRAAVFTQAVRRAPVVNVDCVAGNVDEFVTLRVEGTTSFDPEVYRSYVADFGCEGLQTPAGPDKGVPKKLTDAVQAPWHDRGISRVLMHYIGILG